jgi:hypothetical protein
MNMPHEWGERDDQVAAGRFERRSRTYEARALPTELRQHIVFKLLEAVGRIALPLVCFVGRCLAVLATPSRN